jgi:hypothetical protein
MQDSKFKSFPIYNVDIPSNLTSNSTSSNSNPANISSQSSDYSSNIINQINEENKKITFEKSATINIPLIGDIYVKPLFEYGIGIIFVILLWKMLGLLDRLDNKLLFYLFIFNIFFFLLNIYINTGEVGSLELEETRLYHLEEVLGILISINIIFIAFAGIRDTSIDKDVLKIFVVSIILQLLAYNRIALQNKPSKVRTIRVIKQVIINIVLFLLCAGFVLIIS